MIRRLYRRCGLALTLTALLCLALPAAELSVITTDGRSFSGEIDESSNDRELCLRDRAGNAYLIRPVAWTAIESCRYGERNLSVDEVREHYREWATQLKTTLRTSTLRTNSLRPLPSPAPAKIASLAIEASPGNWNTDAATDGLLLRVIALDEHGCEVPFQGTVSAEVVGFDFNAGLRAKAARGPITLGTMNGAVDERTRHIKLPYADPQRVAATTLAPFGTVAVRVAIPGHGVFERTLEGIPLRPLGTLNLPFR